MSHRRLPKPPLNEVIVSFKHAPHERLTTPWHGRYWAARGAAFARAEVHPKVFDGAELRFPDLELRTWLVATDETRLVQLQEDRLVVNWRRVAPTDPYPHFTTRDGVSGIEAFALHELEELRRFAGAEAPLELTHVELSKIDMFEQGPHWRDYADLAVLLPVLAPVLRLAGTAPVIQLAVEDAREDEKRALTLVSAMNSTTRNPAIRLEVRTRRAVASDADVASVLRDLNATLNDTFFGLVPEAELSRFE